jgi:hypothetical protein
MTFRYVRNLTELALPIGVDKHMRLWTFGATTLQSSYSMEPTIVSTMWRVEYAFLTTLEHEPRSPFGRPLLQNCSLDDASSNHKNKELTFKPESQGRKQDAIRRACLHAIFAMTTGSCDTALTVREVWVDGRSRSGRQKRCFAGLLAKKVRWSHFRHRGGRDSIRALLLLPQNWRR